MYLKSLSLKGFKSFADKSVLSMEPGLSAVVGPNGSGKSNISDAVLWVLGERSARNLRGQAMEDVIFAGSSSKKPVSIAEVTLVLDNSDATLPVDYNEVSITRRMFRTGESDYLINGVLARRLDVLDILHDSGLGTATNSIISQGSLDDILQSKPEDRRALIEEAAGVLKHKQRKEKSQRKLAAMDAHLVRVKDISGELHKQLGPLERKAKRALRHQRLSAELSGLNLALAVDDLRVLQGKWNETVEREGALEANVQECQEKFQQAQSLAEELQNRLQLMNDDASEAAMRYQRAASVMERLESIDMLLAERRRTVMSAQTDRLRVIEEGKAKLDEAREGALAARKRLDEVSAQAQSADDAVARLTQEAHDNAALRKDLGAFIAKTETSLRNDERELDRLSRRRNELKEALDKGLSQVNLIEAKREDLERRLAQARADAAKRAEALESALADLESLKEAESNARTRAGEALAKKEQAQAAFDALREQAAALGSEIHALEQLERTRNAADSARGWALSHAEAHHITLLPLAHVLRVSPEWEELTERFLGQQVSTLLASDSETAQELAFALLQSQREGEVSLLAARKQGAPSMARRAAQAGFGRALLDEISYPDEYAASAEKLLGQVLLFDCLEDALRARSSLETWQEKHCSADGLSVASLCLLTKDGCVLRPDGCLVVGLESKEAASDASASSSASSSSGVFASARRLRCLREEQEETSSRQRQAAEALELSEQEFISAQENNLRCVQLRAEAQGKADSARSSLRQAEGLVTTLERDYHDIDRQRLQAQHSVDEARPQLTLLETSIETVGVRISDTQDLLNRKKEESKPLKEAGWAVTEKLNQAKLDAAKLHERKTYEGRMLERSESEKQTLLRQIATAQAAFDSGKAASFRIDPLRECVRKLRAGALSCAEFLQEQRFAAQGRSSGLAQEATEARAAVRAAQGCLSAAVEELSQARIEKSRLEAQVEGAVDAIVRTCGTPLETALELPRLEERNRTEDEADKLKRQIASMGAINPDAALEYEEMKGRCDYLDAQLADLESARKSLTKIVAAIDERMKGDFIDTFEKVDDNFQEIFSILFPGGTARLTLSNPLDLENTGVEVSAQPRGKRITKMMLLSGGEKSLVALALLFAVYKTRATPFYILDEVEAALDDSNLRRLLDYLEVVKKNTQLIMITHQRRTMESASVLFGVTMRADGVSKVVSQRLEKALQYAEK